MNDKHLKGTNTSKKKYNALDILNHEIVTLSNTANLANMFSFSSIYMPEDPNNSTDGLSDLEEDKKPKNKK